MTEVIIGKALSYLDVDPTLRPQLVPHLVELGQTEKALDWNVSLVRAPLERAMRS